MLNDISCNSIECYTEFSTLNCFGHQNDEAMAFIQDEIEGEYNNIFTKDYLNNIEDCIDNTSQLLSINEGNEGLKYTEPKKSSEPQTKQKPSVNIDNTPPSTNGSFKITTNLSLKKRGRPKKSEENSSESSLQRSLLRTDNIRIKLLRDVLNFCVYFINAKINEYYKKKQLGFPPRFYKINTRFKVEHKNIKSCKLGDILKLKNDNKSHSDEPNINFNEKTYEETKIIEEINNYFKLDLCEFINKFYISKPVDFDDSYIEPRPKNIFFDALKERNRERGKSYLQIMEIILKEFITKKSLLILNKDCI